MKFDCKTPKELLMFARDISKRIDAKLPKFFNLKMFFYKTIFLNLLIPKKYLSLPKQLYNSVDQIWFIAGDSSVDFNFYTKRLILSGIYSRIMLFFFNNDDQDGLERILDEDLKRVSKIPELKTKFNIFKDYLPQAIKFVKNSI